MSYLFALDPLAAANADESARFGRQAQPAAAPWLTMRTPLGAFAGLAQGAAETGYVLDEAMGAATPVAQEIDKQFGTDMAGWITKNTQAARDTVVSRVAPDPYTVGQAGQIASGVGKGLAIAAGGFAVGGPVGAYGALVTVEGMAAYRRLRAEGVDENTALAAAAQQGAFAGAGAVIPMAIPGSLAKSLLFGAGVSVGTGFAQRAVVSNTLADAGYKDMAAQYAHTDATGIAVDVILGAAFGAWGHAMHGRRPTAAELDPGHVDAALTANTARHIESTAPGIPTDIAARNAHVNALVKATEDLLQDKPAEVTKEVERGAPPEVAPGEVQRPAFMPDPGTERYNAEVLAAIEAEHGPAVAEAQRPLEPLVTYSPYEGLSPAGRAIETKFGAEVANYSAAKVRYEAIPETEGGKVISADVARELSAAYMKDRSLSAEVHEPASALVKRLYAEKLAEAPKAGELPLVLFTAGGTGAGKTTGIAKSPEASAIKASAQIVYDTNMNGTKSAMLKVEQALEAGKMVQVLFTYREPVDALVGGALRRATRQENEFGTGRTVPLGVHADTHIESLATVRALAEKYRDDSRVSVLALDNSSPDGVRRLVPLESIPTVAHNELVPRLRAALDAHYEAGLHSEAIHRGFLQGESAQAPATAGVRGGDGKSGDRQSGQGGGASEGRGQGESLSASALPAGAIGGRSDTIRVGEKYEPVQWAVVDARSIAPTMEKGENQARDRTRAASQAQVSKIAAGLDFRLLAESPLMDYGAPTLAADGRIIGGNGRVAAIARAYEMEPDAAKSYADQLRAAADSFGIDPAAIAGLDRPVLVRVLHGEVDVRKAAIASNEGAGLRMSMLEQAAVDAERMPPLDTFYVPESGDLNAPGNHDFIVQWVTKFPSTEQAALVDSAGALSQEGMIRLRNAVLQKAYGDSPVLQRLVESADPGARNVSNALTKAGPAAAAARDAIARGDLHPVDPLPELLAAVEKFAQLRATGDRVADFLAQGQMFGDALAPEARMILAYMDANTRSARAMADMVAGMYRALERAGNPKEGDFFGGAVPDKAGLVRAAIDEAGNPGALTGALFDDPFPGTAQAPRSKASAVYEAGSRVEQAKQDAPLMETAVNCEAAA